MQCKPGYKGFMCGECDTGFSAHGCNCLPAGAPKEGPSTCSKAAPDACASWLNAASQEGVTLSSSASQQGQDGKGWQNVAMAFVVVSFLEFVALAVLIKRALSSGSDASPRSRAKTQEEVDAEFGVGGDKGAV